jgi:hypothetical protein
MELPRPARLLSRLLPSCDRDAIVGDLLEDAAYRRLSGPGLTLWLCAECGQIAAGIAVDRVRGSFVPPVREVAAGLAFENSRTFRHARSGPVGALLSIILFCASAVLIAFSATVLIGTLFSASYR